MQQQQCALLPAYQVLQEVMKRVVRMKVVVTVPWLP
jgi:hypothetical protein